MEQNLTNLLIEKLKNIGFDDFYNEATFQFKLLMQLSKNFNENLIFPERNIEYYKLNSKEYTKKVVDIILENVNNKNIAIELKMPMNGQVPEQMFKFVEDIKFLEELKSSKIFHKCFLVVVTNDTNFWKGLKNDEIYAYFRNKKILNGKIYKPTGENKNIIFYKLNGKYIVEWKMLNNGFGYFIIEIISVQNKRLKKPNS